MTGLAPADEPTYFKVSCVEHLEMLCYVTVCTNCRYTNMQANNKNCGGNKFVSSRVQYRTKCGAQNDGSTTERTLQDKP